MNLHRRSIVGRAAAIGMAAALPVTWSAAARAQTSSRHFAPQPGDWRTFDVTTRVDLPTTTSATRVWVPLPSVQTGWQLPINDTLDSNGSARLASDGAQGVRMVVAEFAAGTAQPQVRVTSRVRTQSRVLGGLRERDGADTLRHALRPTRLLPTDGIVRATALKATQGARGDEAKVRALYD